MNPSRRSIEPDMGMDHRWGRRQATDLPVRFVAKAGTTGTGRVLNISLTGAYLETEVPLRLLSLVYLEPDVSGSGDGTRRCIAASVVRRDALGAGLEWCDFSTEATNLSARLAVLTGSDGGKSRLPTSRDRHQQFIAEKPSMDHATNAYKVETERVKTTQNLRAPCQPRNSEFVGRTHENSLPVEGGRR